MEKVKTILAILVLLVAGCQIFNREFNAICDNWRSDEKGCKSLRQEIVRQDFGKLKHNLISKPEESVIKCLGPPNERFREGKIELYSYFVEPGVQCMEEVEDVIDVYRIALEIQDGIVVGIREIVP